MSRRWRYPRSRRGIFLGIVPASAAPAAPAYVPGFQEPSGRNARLAALGLRRGRFISVPRRVCAPIPGATRARVRVLAVRRGRFFTVPLVGVAPAAATWVAPVLETRRAPARLVRRGQFLTVPRVGAAPAVPTVLPQFSRCRVRVLFARRGHFWSAPNQPAVVASSWVPPITRSRRSPVQPFRRGEYLTAPLPRATWPTRIVSRRTAPLLCRRGQLWRVPWPPPPGPGPYIPRTITSPHRPPARLTRRGVYNDPPWTGASLSCTTPRPNTGITAMPSSGSTARPSTGTTDRPCLLR